MPRSRLLSICIAASVALHLAATVFVLLLPRGDRPAPDVVPVELADLPRAADFLEPKAGIVEGGPVPAPPAPPSPAPVPPRPPASPARSTPAVAQTGQAREPHRAAEPSKPERAPAGEPDGVDAPDAQAQEKPAPGAAAEAPSPAAVDPAPSKSAAGKAPTPPAAPPRPLKELLPKLGALVRAPGEPGGRRGAASGGSAVSTDGKPAERGPITEESGGGVHLSSLASPEIQYLSWYDSIRRKIELVWVYPLEAAQAGAQGEVTIDFVIERNGSVSSIRLVKSSGHKILDDEAIRAIQVVGRARFNPIPKSYNIANLPIRGRFIYIQGGDRMIR